MFYAKNLLLNVCFANHQIMLFYVLSDTYVFPSFDLIILISYTIYQSTPSVFLGYSSSYLGYHCLDLSCKCIYISCHVWFYEQVFPFLESTHILISTSYTHPSTTVTHLPSLTIFLSTTPSTTPPTSFNPIVPLSPSASISIDHFAGTRSATPELSVSSSCCLSSIVIQLFLSI